MLTRPQIETVRKLLFVLKHYVLVRPGLYPPTGRDYLGTGLTPQEIEGLRAVLQVSKLECFQGGTESPAVSDPVAVRRRTQALMNAARTWSIHVAIADLEWLGKGALGRTHSKQNLRPAARFFNLKPETKHLVLIRAGLNVGLEYLVLQHELAHVFLGHGKFYKWRSYGVMELEAELASLMVCKTRGLDSFNASTVYLNGNCDEVSFLSWNNLRRIGYAIRRLNQLHAIAGV